MKIASLTLFLGAFAQGLAKATHAEPHGYLDAKSTYFDGIQVPPLMELTSNNIENEFNRTKYVVVNYGSPWCTHCKVFAPTYQTLYEYYYTSKPPAGLGESSNQTSMTFEEYYDIKFTTMNCAAYYDVCAKNNIRAYPQTALYKKGVAVGSIKGSKKMNIVFDLIENALEAEHPGSRPRYPLLPTPGSNSRPVPKEDEVKGKFPTEENQKPIAADNGAGQRHPST